MCGCTRQRWLMISRSTYLVICGRGGGVLRDIDNVGRRSSTFSKTNTADNACTGRCSRPEVLWSEGCAYLLSSLDELYGNDFSCGLLLSELYKSECPTIQVLDLCRGGHWSHRQLMCCRAAHQGIRVPFAFTYSPPSRSVRDPLKARDDPSATF